MILRRIYDEKLAQAAWLIGCAAAGEAIVIDPNRDIEPLLDVAKRERVRIRHVTETHIHADFLSGSRELAAATGAQLYLSGEGGEEWSYRYAQEDGAILLHDGDRIRVGNITLDAVHTPGHTPEHIAFVVTDTAATEAPIGIISGDFVFVGDVGRPDLLEKAAGHAGTMEDAARTLFNSLSKFRELPEWAQVWPGHGAGSACGKALGAIPSTTVGYELRFNWAFGIRDEDAFVEAVLEGQPEPPRYFAEMKRMNRDGPRVLNGLPKPVRLDDAQLDDWLARGAVVVDTRRAAEYASGYVPGTLSIPLNRAFPNWAGALLPYDEDIALITIDEGAAHEAARDLALIGLDRVAGWFATSAIETRRKETVPSVDAAGLAQQIGTGAIQLIDVRNRSEWDAGHVPGATHIPLARLAGRLAEVRRDTGVVVSCESGSRSAIAAALLRAHGIPATNHGGGFNEWQAAGLPIESGRTAPV